MNDHRPSVVRRLWLLLAAASVAVFAWFHDPFVATQISGPVTMKKVRIGSSCS